MSRIAATAGIVGATILLTACSSAPNCDEPGFYESAEGGDRIVAPEDLDDLAAFKEMGIPEASPRPPREPGSGCLERPPTLRMDRSEDDEAEETEEIEESDASDESQEPEET